MRFRVRLRPERAITVSARVCFLLGGVARKSRNHEHQVIHKHTPRQFDEYSLLAPRIQTPGAGAKGLDK